MLTISYELLEFFRLFLINDGNPAFIVSTRVLWVYIGLDPAHISFNYRSLVTNPTALGVFMSFDITSAIVINVKFEHIFLVFIRNVGQSSL